MYYMALSIKNAFGKYKDTFNEGIVRSCQSHFNVRLKQIFKKLVKIEHGIWILDGQVKTGNATVV